MDHKQEDRHSAAGLEGQRRTSVIAVVGGIQETKEPGRQEGAEEQRQRSSWSASRRWSYVWRQPCGPTRKEQSLLVLFRASRRGRLYHVTDTPEKRSFRHWLTQQPPANHRALRPRAWALPD